MEFLMKAFYTFCHNYESKSYQINSIKSCSSDLSNKQTLKAHSNSSQIFSFQFTLIFNEEIIQYSRTFVFCKSKNISPCTKLLIESFPKTPRTRSEAQAGLLNYKTNYLPSQIDCKQYKRIVFFVFLPDYHFAHPRCVQLCTKTLIPKP